MLNQRYFHLESISPRVLVALQGLGRIERAVYMLHNVFQHSAGDIASALNMTEQAVQDALQRSASVAGGPALVNERLDAGVAD